jgi:ATP-dependent RNA helicase DeaD
VRNLVTQGEGEQPGVIDADKAVELAATLLALAVGDDGPRMRAAQEEYEREQAEGRAARQARETRKHEVSDRGARGDRYDRDRRPARDGEDRPLTRGIRRPAAGTRYRVAVGHKDGVNPGGIVGAITGEGGLTGSDVGKIDIFPSFSLVDITAPLDEGQLDRLSRARVAGRALRITVDRGAPEGRSFDPPARAERFDRSDRPARIDRFERGDRGDRPERSDRFDRSDRYERPGRPARTGGYDRNDGAQGGDRPVRSDRYDRPERRDSTDRPARKPRW